MQQENGVLIIGNGIAGITAARHIRRNSDRKITVISGESEYFFSRTALMYVYMGQLDWNGLKPYEDDFWQKNRISLKRSWVTGVDPNSRTVRLEDGSEISYEDLILATGSLPRRIGCPGEELQGVQGLVSKQDLELLEQNSAGCTHAIIVGGGLIGVELAEMLHSRKIPVSMILREDNFWGNVLPEPDAALISREVRSQGIRLYTASELEEILGDGERITGIRLKSGKEFRCGLLGVTIGVRPNIDFLRSSGLEIATGILVDEYLRTSIEHIYAIGDCAQHRQVRPGREPVEALWYTARMMGETVAQTICGTPFPYRPGNWFNSAKFFDIEYQTYGRVSSLPTGSERQVHWEHRDGKKAITVAYDHDTGFLLGINAFGIRLRHQVLDSWLSQKRGFHYFLDHFPEANFDPEFFRRHQKEIILSFRKAETPWLSAREQEN